MADFYKHKTIAGPMVRGSSLPFRLACLEYGADLVYGPAVSADAILASHRSSADDQTLYFGTPEREYVHFRTRPAEQGRLVFQLLTNSPNKAVEAASKIADLCSAIDLNCGCPEGFATSKGAGSVLMGDPQTVTDVIKALKNNFPLPVSVKHRIHHNVEESIQFAVACEQAGASAVAIHGRVKEQKHKGQVDYESMATVFSHLHCAKIGNGGVKSLADAEQMKQATGCDSVMICSAALANPSVFSVTPQPTIPVAKRMLQIAKEHCDSPKEWRWSMATMLSKDRSLTQRPHFQEVFNYRTFEEFDAAFDSPNPFC